MTETQLQAIEKKAATLSIQDHIKLMEVLARQLMIKSRDPKVNTIGRPFTVWAKVFGMGKMPKLMSNECVHSERLSLISAHSQLM